jgi:hypothetical protein
MTPVTKAGERAAAAAGQEFRSPIIKGRGAWESGCRKSARRICVFPFDTGSNCPEKGVQEGI